MELLTSIPALDAQYGALEWNMYSSFDYDETDTFMVGWRDDIITYKNASGIWDFGPGINVIINSVESPPLWIPPISPSAPAIISVTQNTPGSVNFNIRQPNNGSLAAITSYKYAYSTTFNGTYTSFTSTNLTWNTGATSLVISSLTPGAYFFKLKANNGNDSDESYAFPVTTGITVANYAPLVPTITSVTVSGLSAIINFTQVSNSSVISGYKYAYSTTTSTGTYTSFTTSNLSWTTGATFLRISSLNPGTYFFKLLATSDIDSAASTASSSVVLTNYAPLAPIIRDITSSGTSVTINFTQDVNGFLPVSSYKYLTSTNNITYTSLKNTGLSWTNGATFLTISNLTPGDYYFKLVANNGLDSPALNVSSLVTLSNSAPLAPAITSITVSGRTATINFTQGSNGVVVASYKYAYSTTIGGTYSFINTNMSWTSPATFLTVSNLFTGTYYFKILASDSNNVNSDQSSVSSAVTIGNYAPAAPAITTVVVTGRNARINFTQGTNGSLAVTNYKYAYSTDGNTYSDFTSSNLSWTTGATFLTVSNLSTGTYYLKLISNNGIDSTASNASNAVTVDNFAPQAPTITTVVVTGQTARINFAQESNGSLTITSYQYAYSTDNVTYTSFISSNWTSGTSFITVSSLPSGTYYFKLKANNGLDSVASNASDIVAIDNFAPLAPTITNISVLNGVATIDFTPGDENGSLTVTGYKYATSTNGSTYSDFTSTNVSWSPGASSLSISKLSAGATYYLKLKANNGIDSDASNASNVVTISNFAPVAPLITSVTVSGTTATIDFTQDANGSSPVSSYKYAYSTTINGTYSFINTSMNWSTGAAILTISSLIPRNYYFKIIANNGLDSDVSNNSSLVTINNFAPATPTITSVTVSGRSATINFTQGSNGSLAVTSYKYAYSTTINGTYSFINTNMTWTNGATFLTVSNLFTGDYYFKIIASNGIESTASTTSSVTTIGNYAPNAPTITSVTISGRTATINFTVPTVNGSSAVTSYKYASSTTRTGIYTSFTPIDLTSSTRITVSDLPSGNYAFKLRANNDIDSVDSVASSLVTIANFAPLAPVITQVDVAGTTAIISFTQSSNDSLAITSYRPSFSLDNITYTSFIGVNVSWTPGLFALTVSGLTVGRTYYFKLIAHNGIASPQSEASLPTIISNFAPLAPTITSVSLSGRDVTINFTQTRRTGEGGITSYKHAFSTTSTGTYTSFADSKWISTVGNKVTLYGTELGLTRGNTYYFKLISNNGIDSPSSNASSGVTIFNYAPAAPTITSITVSETTGTINFTQGDNSSFPVTSYKYAFSFNYITRDYSFIDTNWTTGSENKITVPNLYVDHVYYFKIMANNNIDSLESAAFGPITISNFAPLAPIITSVGLSVREALINFTLPQSNNSLAVTSYKYAYSTTSDGPYTTFTDNNGYKLSDTQYRVRNFETGAYYFKFMVNNGIDSNESIASDVLNIAPYSPTIYKISVLGTTVTITFSQNLLYNTDVTSYQYAFKTANNNTYSSYTNTNLLTTGTNTITISNLTQGETFYFKLKSYKNDVASDASNESNGIFINFPPATPQITSIIGKNTQATIEFNVTNNGSAAITRYFYTTDNPVTSDSKFIEFPLQANRQYQTTTPLIANGLSYYQTYSLTIKSFNGLYSNESNTISGVFINSPQFAPSITIATLQNGTAVVNFSQRLSGGTPVITYSYSTDAIITGSSVFTELGSDKLTSPLIITGLPQNQNVAITLKARNGPYSDLISTNSNTVTIIPDVSQPAPIINTSKSTVIAGLTATTGIATIVFTQSSISSRGSDAIIKYLYSISGSDFIDVPLLSGRVQRSSPFVIPFTIENPANTTSRTFRFKSVTVNNAISLASTTATMTVLYAQPPPIIVSAVGDGTGIATITVRQDTRYSYAQPITNYSFSLDGTYFTYFEPAQTVGSFKVYGIYDNPTYNFTFKSFNGLDSIASNTVENVFVNYYAQPSPVITYVNGTQGTAIVEFTQGIYESTKELAGFAYSINNNKEYTNLNIAITERTFTITGLANGVYTITMKSTNGLFSDASNTLSFMMLSINSSTYIDPEDI